MALLEKLIVGLGIDTSEYDKGLADAESSTSSFGSKLGGMLGGALKVGLAATAGTIVGAIGAIVSGVASNAEFERYETQFGVLLGSTEAAQKRLEELAAFGAKTPFELPEVVKADKILQGFGLHSEEAAKKFGFSGTEIRTIAGDLAAGTGSSFEEMSLLLGKFSAGATGEAISRMAELGIASRDSLTQMGLEFDKSGALLTPLPEAMNVVLGLMKDKYGGMMDAQSATFEGMMSNLQDWVAGTLRTISAPIFEVVKDKLGVLLAFLNAPETQATLNSLATALADGVGAAIDYISNTVIPAALTAWNAISLVFETVRTVIQGVADEIAIFLGYDPGEWGSSWLDTITELGTVLAQFFQPALDIVTTLFGRLFEIIAGLVPDLGALNDTVHDNGFPELGAVLAVVYKAFQDFSTFVSQNVDAILAGLAAILLYTVIPAFWAWVTAAIATAAANIAALAPILIPIAAIGLAVGLLYAAWNSNFLGIRDIITNIWDNYLHPIFIQVYNWLATNIPVAIQTVSDYWTNTLKPALLAVWSFIDKYIIPIFIAVVKTHIAAMQTALQTLANFWTNTLKPAIVGVWSFLNTYIIPLFRAIVNVNIAAFSLALRTLAGIWSNVVLPALRSAWSYLNTNVVPILTMLYDKVINQGLKPALQSIAFFILGTLIPQFMAIKATVSGTLGPSLETAKSALGGVRDAFGWIDKAIQDTIGWIQSVADKLNSIDIPDWLQGHSPPPMAHWFGFIAGATKAASVALDEYTAQLASGAATAATMPNTVLGSAQDLTQQNISIPISANYAYQDERTVRDEIRMQAMLWGVKPI